MDNLLISVCDADKNHETISVDMLLGIYIFQYMSSVTWKEVLGGSCLVLHNNAAPMRPVFNFLNNNQSKSLIKSLKKTNQEILSPQTKTMINLVTDPLKSYFNLLEHILEDSKVDNGLEHLFSLESMGIKKDNRELVSFDKDQIDKFKEGIIFKDWYYNVELPWYPYKINSVPSNQFVVLKVLNRTEDHLKRKGLINKYQEEFDKQLEDGIIEEIKVKPSNYEKYVWISHRPVIKFLR